jgi:hypothetical protein
MKRLWVYSLALMGVLSLGACQQKTTVVSAAPAPAAAPVVVSTAAVVASTNTVPATPTTAPADAAEKK